MNKKTLFRVLFAGGAVAILALLAPVIWAALSAGVGLIGLAVIGIIGFGLLQMLPVLGQKLENFVLKARKSEARKNPIEQLQNFFIEKKRRVEQFKAAVVSINSQISNLEDMVRRRKQSKPNYDSTEEDRSIKQMRQVYQNMQAKYVNATDALVKLEETIEEKKFKWQFSQAGMAAIAALNASSGEDLFNQMLADEASSAVLDNFNKVFAELELEATSITETKQLSFDSGMVLDMSNINLAQKV